MLFNHELLDSEENKGNQTSFAKEQNSISRIMNGPLEVNIS